ncbi:LOW QUALITY PROTEIN: uncharacterized protein KZ484_026972 [Pholidichthys leucotaenia]
MSETCLRVAIRIRPLVPTEVLHHHQVCVRVVPDSAQVMLGSDRLFSFDHAFGPTASQDEVYESCVQPLVQSLLSGCNATVFCYGQTGSGKTYTLGAGNQDEDGGIIDRVAQDVFLMLGEKKKSENVEVTVQVSHMELYGEDLRDLLEMHNIHKELHIRTDKRGNTVVVGAKEVVVTSAEELLRIVETGNSLRHTDTTGMNEHSSRSHAILTIQVTQCYQSTSELSVCSSKLCLVDLAGSECAGTTGNTGMQLKESGHINKSLLVLGYVIRALSDRSRNHRGRTSRGAYIPYRDAKLTLLLRDSLGGTAHTLMVACVSPSHHFVVETLNVLQFASKARHIRNRPGAASAQTGTLRELLKEKEREVELEREKTTRSGGEGDRMTESDEKRNQEELAQYRLLTQEAATLFSNISGASLSLSFRKHLQDWQERLTAVNQSHQTGDEDLVKMTGHQPDHVTMLKLKEELKKCQETLHVRQQLRKASKDAASKDAELKQIPFSPAAYSLERVMAAFKVRGHLLLAEMDEKDEVYCPFLKNQEDSKENEEEKKEKEMEEKDDVSMSRMGFRSSQNLLHVSTKLESLEDHQQRSRGVQKTGGATIDELEKERDLKKRRDALNSQLKDNRVLTVEEEHSLLQLEAIEALDAALKLKPLNHDRHKKLMATGFSLHQSQNAEPAQLWCDVTQKLKDLPAPEALELLVKYFNKVVFLREVAQHLRLRCDELELHTGEQKAALREMEAAMQRLALDADRRLTQQHRDYQNNIQTLIQQLKGVPGEAQQATQARLQHLEKEQFFYKSTSRQLRKKLKEPLSDGLHADDKPSHTQQCRQMHNKNPCGRVRMTTHISTTDEKTSAEQMDKKTHSDSCTDGHLHRASSPDREALSKTKMSDNAHVHTHLQGSKAKGQSGETVEMIPVRLCRRVLKPISEADLQVSGFATRGRASVVDTSTETMFEDSIEVPRNTDR